MANTPSGRRYAMEHARATPFFALGWGARDGAILVPGLPASAVHAFLDDAEASAVMGRPKLAEFIPDRPPSAWMPNRDVHGWWPDRSQFG